MNTPHQGSFPYTRQFNCLPNTCFSHQLAFFWRNFFLNVSERNAWRTGWFPNLPFFSSTFFFSKPRLGRPPKQLRLEPPKPEPSEESIEIPEKKPKRKHFKEAHITRLAAETEQKASALIERSKILPAEVESWHKHSQFLKCFISTDIDPRSWSNCEVIEFVSTIPCCQIESDIFRKEAIDGEALLSLNQRDILTILKLKVGPAVKLYNSIVLLRQHVDEKLYA